MEKKMIKIVTVCGNGIGSSLLLRMKVEAIAKEYGSVGGATQLFEALGKVEQKYHAGNSITWLSTHPDTRERQANVNRIASQSGYATTPAKLPNVWQKKQSDAP